EAPPVHRRLHAASEGVLAGVAELLVVVPLGQVLRPIQRLDVARRRLEALAALREAPDSLAIGARQPVVIALARHGTALTVLPPGRAPARGRRDVAAQVTSWAESRSSGRARSTHDGQ